MTENSIDKNNALENLTNKLLEFFKDGVRGASYLLSP